MRAIVFDLDNTLCRWREDALSPATEALLESLQHRGFQLAVLSNGRLARRQQLLTRLARLNMVVVWPARKPCPGGFRWVVRAMGVKPAQAAMVGDQLFTDVLGARVAGLRAVLVRPVSRREHAATRALRWLERLVGRSIGVCLVVVAWLWHPG